MKPFVDIMVQTYVETMREHPDEKEEDEPLLVLFLLLSLPLLI